MKDIHVNGSLTRRSTARGLILAAALLSFVLSVFLYFGGDETEGIFVAIWVPSILALGAFVAPRHEPAPIPGVRGRESE
jgi:hypothetical protein